MKAQETYIDVNAYSIQNRYNIEEALSAPKQGQKCPNNLQDTHENWASKNSNASKRLLHTRHVMYK